MYIGSTIIKSKMKKLFLVLIFIPLLSFSQKLIKESIEPFKGHLSEPVYGGSIESFFKGYWINTSEVLKLAGTTFGIPIFNSGPHTKEYFDSMCFCNDFGHYNPLFLDKVKESIKSLSPSIKALIQPLYDFYFKKPLRKLMQNKISDYFDKDSDNALLEQIRKKENHNSLLSEIKSTNPEIPSETLFWIRRDYDGTSYKFLKLFQLITEEFDEFEREYYVTSKSGLNVREQPYSNSNKKGIILYNQKVRILSRSGEKLIIKDTDKETGVTKTIEGEWVKVIYGENLNGFVFDGYLGKNNASFLTRNNGTTWTNGFSSYTFSKDMPDYYIDISSCNPCNTPTTECHMCGYNWMKVDIDSFSFGSNYQNDFFYEEDYTQFFEKNGAIWSFESRGGYVVEYKTDKISWIPADSEANEIEKIRVKNKPILDFIKLKKKEDNEAIERDFM